MANNSNDFNFDGSDSRIKSVIYYSIWGLAVQYIQSIFNKIKLKNFQYSSIASCLLRNDYNIVFSFLFLFIYSNVSTESKKYFSKIMIHITICLIFGDLFWITILNSNLKTKKSVNLTFLKSLSGMQSFINFLGIFEILIKFVILGALIFDFRTVFPSDTKFLVNFYYKLPESTNEEI